MGLSLGIRGLMLVSLLAATMLLADAAPAAAAPATSTPAQAGVLAAPQKDPLVCKNQPLLGSRMAKKICMTKSEWEERRQRDKQDLDSQQKHDPSPHL